MGQFPVTITVSEYAVSRCKAFSEIMSHQNQAHEFNNSGTGKRTPEEIYHDNLLGKFAEVAVYIFLRRFDLPISKVDLSIIGANKRDHGDFNCHGLKISVKATAKGSMLMVHQGQLRWELADVFVLCRVSIEKARVTILGYAYKHELVDLTYYSHWLVKGGTLAGGLCGSRSKFVRVGEMPEGLAIPWQSTNVYIMGKSLRMDIDEFVEKLRPA